MTTAGSRALSARGSVLWPSRGTAPRPSGTGFEPAVLRSLWGCYRRHAEFIRWLDDAGERVPILNPPSVLSWNADKHHLLRLAERGIPTVPTIVVDRGSGPAVQSTGEASLIFIDGRFSHAVLTYPAGGDRRGQGCFGASERRIERSDDLLAAAGDALAAAPGGLLYARVDPIEAASHVPLLMELEVLEPDVPSRAVGRRAHGRGRPRPFSSTTSPLEGSPHR